ncbi:hypothetical protein KAFR_0F02530 [Kazachstania africana CBS 2517]|uniref:Rad21/Rec8-like protein N-terminal domain-containing protein n=1 Tax=Kazachstania africana (strain ATCC 22294 / BCRC 22015 / CBS 2517 / CECT 1963 / NBRC 1671 / NRRL Y-8276) TaxID=1071382 RepID=H2AWV0_KAZAF|nr:hypothetical protein KAFR_0F02530 [Kazachstania africana CBS 2517]CCF58850.1 hypothetical protein KAFR_0F02530 [Kazachstania africana CBS 2517]
MSTEGNHPYTVLKITASNGALAQIWLAANMSNLPKGSVLQTNIRESAEELAKVSGCDIEASENSNSITLRTSGELLQGIVRVYSKQAGFLLSDIKDTLSKISSLFKANARVNITISRSQTVAKVDQLILEDAVTEREVLITPGLEFLDDAPLPSGLLLTNDSVRRNVHGAAPWDMSIEVGRRFEPDNDFANETSGLDLDFDIEGTRSSPTRSWDEGTRHSNNTTFLQSMKANENVAVGNSLIAEADDDFPIADTENDHWDLGIVEDDKQADSTSIGSIEFGRRVDDVSIQENPDFGFDLEIEKEPSNNLNILNQSEHYRSDNTSDMDKQIKKKARRAQNPALNSTTKIVYDETSELSTEEMEDREGLCMTDEKESDVKAGKLAQKRLWSEILLELQYLPNTVVENLVSHVAMKKKRLSPAHNRDTKQPIIDMSLDMNDMIEDSDDGLIDEENKEPESDHFIGIDNQLSDFSFGQTFDGESSELIEENKGSTVDTSNSRVKLISGSFVSRTTADMAEILRETSIDKETMDFKDLLMAQYEREPESKTSKSDASRCFFDMLSLATADCIELKQDEIFGNIRISTKASLFDQFITVS